MKKSKILKLLTFETCTEVQLYVYSSPECSHPLSGIFTPLVAMQFIRLLPPKFVYGYIPIE